MTRHDLAIEVARQMGGSKKDAMNYIDAVLEGIRIGMKRDGEVKLNNFGTLYGYVKPEHEAKNPKTGEIITVPERIWPKVKFSSTVKEYLNG